MPSKRTKLIRQRRDATPDLPDWLRHRLLTGENCGPRCPAAVCCSPDDPGGGWECFDADLAGAWQANRDALLRAWIRDYPGTRPWAWWRYDAPEERQRLGGHGRAVHEVFAYAPAFQAGIPVLLLATDPMAEGKNARHAASHTDPPVFESEAAYLKRHGLLESGESRRIRAEAFEPEVLSVPPPRAVRSRWRSDCPHPAGCRLRPVPARRGTGAVLATAAVGGAAAPCRP